jgi:hypothetical protein
MPCRKERMSSLFRRNRADTRGGKKWKGEALADAPTHRVPREFGFGAHALVLRGKSLARKLSGVG